MSILILGLGNILLEDEGIGVRTVEALQAGWRLPDSVVTVDGGTAGMDLLDTIAGHPHIIVVDAVRTGAEPGSIVVLEGDAVPAFFKGRVSPHQIGLSDMLAALRLQDEEPESVTVIGCVPFSMRTTLDLSPAMAARLPDMVAGVLAALARLGVDEESGLRPLPSPV
jgi:hydrogenase maturation protease